MPDRRVCDWRNGVDTDEEMAAWRQSDRRAQGVFAFFMAAIAGTQTLLGRRAT